MYKIKNETESECELLLYDTILEGITAQGIIGRLNGNKALKSITLRINSSGGDSFEALAIYNYLKASGADITVIVDGLAASAATIAACAGRVIMYDNSMFMIHNPLSYIYGESSELKELAALMDKIKENIISVYMNKSGLGHDEISALMDKQTWLNAEEAKTLGFCDEIIHHENSNADPVEPAVMERERLKELDSLMTLENRAVINRAKYETFQSAKDIAIELLRIQSRANDSKVLSSISPVSLGVKDTAADMVSSIINKKRGYK